MFYLWHVSHSILLLASSCSPLKKSARQSLKLTCIFPTSVPDLPTRAYLKRLDQTRTYQLERVEVFSASLRGSTKSADCLSFKQALEDLRNEGEVGVLVRERNILEVAERCLNHVLKKNLEELSRITLKPNLE